MRIKNFYPTTRFYPVIALCLAFHTTGSAQTVFNLDFDHAYFLPSDLTGKGFGATETTSVTSIGSGVPMNRMSLWDEGNVNYTERQAGKGAYNSVVSDIDWNSTASLTNPIDGNGPSDSTPNYREIEVNDFWKGLGIQIVSNNTLSILDSHDYVLNDGVGGDGNPGADAVYDIGDGNIRGGRGGLGGDGDDDNLTGNDPNVVANKSKKNAANNTAPNALAMGNLLINEEGPGDGIPDDAGSGDVKRFEIDDEAAYVKDGNGDPFSVQAQLDRFAFVDDVEAEVVIALKNPNNSSDGANVLLTSVQIPALGFDLPASTGENQIYFVDVEAEIAAYHATLTNPAFDYTTAYLDYWEIDYNSSGGLGEVQFSFLNTAPPPVPEASTVLGAGTLMGLIAFRVLRRRRRAA